MAGLGSAAVLIAAFMAVTACCAIVAVRLYRPRSSAGPGRPGDGA